ncbi:hypothetical protein [Intestinirhabdus alba]|jgi:hypothetical protein|uniref:hypothetical protein n=1 Tax=Intestinirhabdus alba TaxID=2899544 RepID=UPI0012BB11CA|nr:hypothetical protein [Intestinirhabdus alba]
MDFNVYEYNKLISSLKILSDLLKSESFIDKGLALYLYEIPQMIRNAHASFDKCKNKTELALSLEEAWIELDSLAINCLS